MQTPTKKVKIGRKPASEYSGDFCWLCKCAFKMKFGDIDDIKGHTIILVCGEIITIQTVASLFACLSNSCFARRYSREIGSFQRQNLLVIQQEHRF